MDKFLTSERARYHDEPKAMIFQMVCQEGRKYFWFIPAAEGRKEPTSLWVISFFPPSVSSQPFSIQVMGGEQREGRKEGLLVFVHLFPTFCPCPYFLHITPTCAQVTKTDLQLKMYILVFPTYPHHCHLWNCCLSIDKMWNWRENIAFWVGKMKGNCQYIDVMWGNMKRYCGVGQELGKL